MLLILYRLRAFFISHFFLLRLSLDINYTQSHKKGLYKVGVMFFFIDRFDQIQTVEVFPTINKLAIYVLGKLGVSLELGADLVKLAQKSLGNRGKVVSLTGAFKEIANSPGEQAQALALQFQQAVERYKK